MKNVAVDMHVAADKFKFVSVTEINVKKCSFYRLLMATDRKQQKS